MDEFSGHARRVATLLSVLVAVSPVWAEETAGSGNAAPATPGQNPFLFSPPDRLTYDTEYPAMGYSGLATANAVARLQDRLDRGDIKLTFNEPRGYLDSLLATLDIDPSSQALVYSKTSFQVGGIRASSPRALYFNDNTYVAWVPGGELLEIGAMDSRLGPVFYTLPNRSSAVTRFDRPLVACISCHDSLTMTGGGVPRFILGSGYVGINGEQLTHEGRILTTDRTPLRSRWGGWYVTGRHGNQVHLGNMQIRSVSELTDLESARRGNLDNLDGLFDTQPYLTNKSDIVALLVFQHQITVQNLITRANFEVRKVLAQAGLSGRVADTAVVEFPAEVQAPLAEFLDALVNGMLFVNAAGYTSPVSGNAGFAAWFEPRGPRDSQRRSLRKLDLTSRLFTYPLSYLIYSEAFDSLPHYAKSHVYGKLRTVLSGQDQSPEYGHLGAAERKAIMEILNATKPDFAGFAAAEN